MLSAKSLEVNGQIKSRWTNVLASQWDDWHWQLANRIRTLDELRALLRLTPDEELGIQRATERFRMEITPYFATLMDPDDSDCPIRRQVIPSAAELVVTPSEQVDPLAEKKHTPVPAVIHRYPDRVLFFPTLHCAAYCRFCTRSRIVGHIEETVPFDELEPAFEYLRTHHEIRDVVISGGDPLTIGDRKLEFLLSTLRSIEHIEILRIHTRVPIFLPQRIDGALTTMLKKYHPFFMSIHVNHPKEITPEAAEACTRLADAGIPLGGQTVLLKGINDDVVTMKKLMHELMKVRIRPYYLNHCDLVAGTSHMRTSVADGIAIIEGLRGHTSGFAVPTFVIDTPAGGGKIPVGPQYVISNDDGRLTLRNYRNEFYEYVDD
ncbi:MAG TPA: KamA family radical SAM protein [Pyrinomonadaceae bacterium]